MCSFKIRLVAYEVKSFCGFYIFYFRGFVITSHSQGTHHNITYPGPERNEGTGVGDTYYPLPCLNPQSMMILGVNKKNLQAMLMALKNLKTTSPIFLHIFQTEG